MQSIWLHGHCSTHGWVFVTDEGMNPRWVKPGDPSWSVIREQYDKQKQDLHMRRCQKCVDELVAQVTKHWPQKASRAAG
jgi:hypothetical protein